MKHKKPSVSSKYAFKKLSSFLSQYKFLIIVSSLSGLIGAIAGLCVPLAIRQISILIITAVSPGGVWDFSSILFWGFITLSLQLVSLIFQIIQSFIVYSVASKIGYSIRAKIIQKISFLPISYFDSHDTGEILSYITNDSEMLSSSLSAILFNSLYATVTLFGSIIILFIFNYVIGLSILLSLPLILLVISLISKKTIENYTKHQNLLSEITSRSEENYDAQMIIKAFNAEERYQEKFDRINESLRKTSIIAQLFGEIFTPILRFFANILFAVICLVAGYLIGSSGGSPEDVATIVSSISYGTQIITPLLIFAQLFANSGRISASSIRIFSFIDETEEPNEIDKKIEIGKIYGNVNFKNVSFGYDKREVISDFTQTIKKGQKVAIVGHTGAGKTTLINLLMRFYEINKGAIEIEGIDTKKMNRKYVRSLFSMVLQDAWLFEGTFIDNIKFANKNISDEEVYRACKITHCDQFIKQMGGYRAKINHQAGLSSGQMQLLNIARAVAQNAPLLILDEATSNVDVRTETIIQKTLDKIMKNKTSFIIAHRLSTIKNADIILVMKNGKIVESGKHDELLEKNGVYADIYYSQFCL